VVNKIIKQNLGLDIIKLIDIQGKIQAKRYPPQDSSPSHYFA